MKTRAMKKLATLLVGALAFSSTVTLAQDKPQATPTPKSAVLITNAKVFDGKSDKLTGPMSVLIESNKIAKIAASIDAPAGATVIDAGGRTLSPGFMDAHAHVTMQMSYSKGFRSDQWYYALVGAEAARVYLSRGYTTIRDAGGNPFSLKMAIDEGLIRGPRIFPSGPQISQSSGHADHRYPNEPSMLLGGERDLFQKYGLQLVADGEAEVLEAVRDTLRRGASQIKIATGGGTGSEGDPLDVVQYTSEEVRAAVNAAAGWNTYVVAHVYNANGIRHAVDNGVKSIEHGNLIDEDTMRYMKKKDIWLSPQVSVYTSEPQGYTEDQLRKHKQAFDGVDNMFKIAKKIGFEKIAFGTDIFTDMEQLKRGTRSSCTAASGSPRPGSSSRRPTTTASWWRCRGRAAPTRASSA